MDVDVNSSGINEVELDDIVTNTIKGTKINEPTIHYRLPKTEIDIVVGDVR